MSNIKQVLFGDCLELMKNIPDESIDMILCDLPYQVTARQKWDIIIPFGSLWAQYERIIKKNAAIVLTATEPFRTKLIMSNMKLFKYDLIWVKNNITGFLNAKKQPLRQHESILVFYKNQPIYHPQKTTGHLPVNTYTHHKGANTLVYSETQAGFKGGGQTDRYPTSILNFPVINNRKQKYHPSEKPIALMEYLIKTYTNEGDLVLDNCAGGGSTLIAAKNLNRQFIGIEKEKCYYDIILKRLEINSKFCIM